MKKFRRKSPGLIQLRSEFIRRAVCFLLMPAMVLPARAYVEKKTCPTQTETCPPDPNRCCVHSEYEIDGDGVKQYVSSELVYGPDCADMEIDVSPPVGAPVDQPAACTIGCTGGGTDPGGGAPGGSPETLEDIEDQSISLGSDGNGAAQGTVSISLTPEPPTIIVTDPGTGLDLVVPNPVSVADVNRVLATGVALSDYEATDANNLVTRQYHAPQGLFTFVENADGSLSLTVFRRADVQNPTATDALQTPIAGRSAITSMSFSRFADFTGENYIRIEGTYLGKPYLRIVGGSVDGASGGVMKEIKDGMMIETTHSYVDALAAHPLAAKALRDHDGFIHIQEVRKHKAGIDGNGGPVWVLVSTSMQAFQTLLVTRREVMLEEIVSGPTIGTLVTRTNYEDQYTIDMGGTSTVNKAFGGIASQQKPDGSWVIYDYDYVTGMVWRMQKPWLSSPASLDAALAMTPAQRLAACYVEEYTYGPDDPLESFTRVTTVPGLAGPVEVARQVKSSVGMGSSREETTTATRRRLGSNGVVTTFTLTERKLWGIDGAGRRTLYNQRPPDGSWIFHSRAVGDYDSETGVFTEAENGAFRAVSVISGTTSNGAEIIGKTRKTVTITDQAGLTVRESAAIATTAGGSAPAASYAEYEGRIYTYDDKNRLTTTTALDGTVLEDISYTDLGLFLESKTVRDASGTATMYFFGQDGTEISRTTLGGASGSDTIPNAYQWTGVEPVGSEFSSTSQWVNGVRVATLVRDSAGRTASRKDQLGRVTSYSYQFAAPSGSTMVNRVHEALHNGANRVTERFLDGRLRSITGSSVVAEHYSYQVNADGTLTTEVRTAAPDSPRWRRQILDFSGQVLKEEKPSPSDNSQTVVTSYFHDSAGRLVRTARPGLGDQIIQYGPAGDVAARGTDMDGDHLLAPGSSDIVTETSSTISVSDGHGLQTDVTRSYVSAAQPELTLDRTVVRHLGCGPACAAETTTTEPDGSIRREITVTNRATATKTVTRKLTRQGEAEQTVGTQKYLAGYLVRETVAGVAGEIAHSYDAFGRRTATYDPRSSVRYWEYDNVTGQLISATTGPSRLLYQHAPVTEDADGNPDTPETPHPMAGLLIAIIPDNGLSLPMEVKSYDLMGRVVFQGGEDYPVSYSFDAYGQQATMTTYGADTPATTTWTYQPGTGLLAAKTDAASKSTTYTYNAAGRIQTRTWARTAAGQPLITTYTYDPAGRQTGVDYSDTTPDVAAAYDSLGRPTAITDASGTRAFRYEGPGSAFNGLTYVGAGGILAGFGLGHWHDDQGRRAYVVSEHNGLTLAFTEYSYDLASGRIATISHGGSTATYDWSSQVGGLPAQITYSGSGLVGARVPDAHRRLDAISWSLGSQPAFLSNDYTLDDRGRRTATAREDSQDWTYGYNHRGEVISASRGGMSHTYSYDEIGNRRWAETAGVNSAESEFSHYTANTLNQYTAIENPDPGSRTVRGQVNAGVVVSASQAAPGQAPSPLPVAQSGQQFSATATAAVTDGPAWRRMAVEARKPGGGAAGQDLVVSRESGFYFPPRDETLSYDADGNLTQDGRWTYEWDGENRLRAQQTTAAAVIAGVPSQRIEYAYDSQSRRVRKVVKSISPQTQTFVSTTDLRFIYDGWNLIAEVESTTLQNSTTPTLRLAATHAWGLDLSGTETGAGGVGGLVLTNLYSSTAQPPFSNAQLSSTALLAPAYDGNGNVLAYVDLQTNSIAARYEYDPFGKGMVAEESPAVAGRLHHQFSTKYLDEETGLSYYGFRYYSPEMGRWLSRDPIEERGGINMYGMCVNNSINTWDVNGRESGFGASAGGGLALTPWGIDISVGGMITNCHRICITATITLSVGVGGGIHGGAGLTGSISDSPQDGASITAGAGGWVATPEGGGSAYIEGNNNGVWAGGAKGEAGTGAWVGGRLSFNCTGCGDIEGGFFGGAFAAKDAMINTAKCVKDFLETISKAN